MLVTKLQAEFPEKLAYLFSPARYKVAYGGRGGAKSWGFARALLLIGVQRPLRILCARETQQSIAESVHQLLSDQIIALGLSSHYAVLKSTITGINGTEFIFGGLRNNVHNIKSLESVDIVWVEEAHKVSKDSWDTLIPTIRKDNSEIWISFNPDMASDNTWQRFVLATPPGCERVKVGWQDNPWFPEVLDMERRYCQQVDPDGYQNIWEGYCKSTISGAIYAAEIKKAETDGRITQVPYDARFAVDTCWDLGFGDRVSIWFTQQVALQRRVIDYYCNTHKSIDYYLQIMQSKGYTYGRAMLPWDGDTPELGSGVSIAAKMQSKGFKVLSVPKGKVHVGIDAVRTLFSQLWFDADKCQNPPRGFVDQFAIEERSSWIDNWGLSGLRRYQYGDPSKDGQEKREPLHNLASHPADALRTMATWIRNPQPQQQQRPKTLVTAWS